MFFLKLFTCSWEVKYVFLKLPYFFPMSPFDPWKMLEKQKFSYVFGKEGGQQDSIKGVL